MPLGSRIWKAESCPAARRPRVGAVDGVVRAEIEAGLVVLLGVGEGDTDADADRLAGKIARLRIFEDEDGRFDRSLLDVGGAALVVSQFTLLADTREGQPPELHRGRSRGGRGAALRAVLRGTARAGVPVETGVFGARMQVELVNDGPVTIVLDA